MRAKNYSEQARAYLGRTARTERRYLVPDSSHGWTGDLAEAQQWAKLAARRSNEPVPVLTQVATFTPWTVVSDHVSADV